MAIVGCGGSGSGSGGGPVGGALAYGEPMPLQAPAGATVVEVTAHSSDGRLVGTITAGGVSQAAYWSSPTAAPVILQGPTTGETVTANDVNSSGEIAGMSLASNKLSSRAVVWLNSASKPITLPTASGDVNRYAASINDKHEIVGGNQTPTATRLYYWPSPKATAYTEVQGGALYTAPIKIDSSGQIFAVNPTNYDALVWSSYASATPTAITQLGGAAGQSVHLNAISDNGTAVGTTTDSASLNESKGPTLWLSPSYTPTAPPLSSQSYDLQFGSLSGINDAGAYVGSLVPVGGSVTDRAYIWLSGQNNAPLSTYLPSDAQSFAQDAPAAILNDYSLILNQVTAGGHVAYYVPATSHP